MSEKPSFIGNTPENKKTKNNKEFRKKAICVLLAACLTTIYITSNHFNENSEVKAGKLLASSEYYEPTTFDGTFTGEIENETELESGTYKCIDVTANEGKFKIKPGAEIHLWLEGNNTFNGKDGLTEGEAGTAGIYVPGTATLYLHGSGNLTATGGNGAAAGTGKNGVFLWSDSDTYTKKEITYNMIGDTAGTNNDYGIFTDASGYGQTTDTQADGGSGAGGGGAAIGTNGTNGGSGGTGSTRHYYYKSLTWNWKGNPAENGGDSSTPEKAGTVYFLSTGNVNLNAGNGGEAATTAGKGMPEKLTKQSMDKGYHLLGDYYDAANTVIAYNDQKSSCVFGGGGGSGGSGNNGKACGSGGCGGGGGGGGGSWRDNDDTFLFSDDYRRTKSGHEKICYTFLDVDSGIFNVDEYKYHYFYTMGQNGGAGGGGGGGGGIGGGGGSGFLKYNFISSDSSTGVKRMNNNIHNSQTSNSNNKLYRYREAFPRNYGYGGSGTDGADIINTTYAQSFEKNHYSCYIRITDDAGQERYCYPTAFGGTAGANSDGNAGGVGGSGESKATPATKYSYNGNDYYVTLSNPGGKGGNGGTKAGGETDSQTYYHSYLSNLSGVLGSNTQPIENLYRSSLSITIDDGKFVASSNATNRQYTWEMYNDDDTPVEIPEDYKHAAELPINSAYIGKTVKLIATPLNDNSEAVGMNEVSYKFSVNLAECTLTNQNSDITVDESSHKNIAQYTGSEVKPDLKVSYYGTFVPSNTYTIGYSSADLTNPQDDITVTVASSSTEAEPNVYGSNTRFVYSIVARDMENLNVVLSDTEFEYDGTLKQPTVTVKYGSQTLYEGTHYTVDYKDAEKNDETGGLNVLDSFTPSIGTKVVRVTGKEGSGYTETKTIEYKITPIDISNFSVTLNPDHSDYDGNPLDTNNIGITVRKDENSPILTKGTDYTVSWEPEDLTSAGEKTITISGNGNYSGSTKASYTINGTSMDGSESSGSSISYEINPSEFRYNSQSQKPSVTVKFTKSGNTTTLTENTDYTITWPEDTITAGEKTITITGNASRGYVGSVAKKYTISPVPDSEINITLDPSIMFYNGEDMIPKVDITYGDITLQKDTDYTLSVSKDTESPGEKLITATFKGNYSGSKTVKYNVNKVDRQAIYGDGLTISLAELLGDSYDMQNADFTISNNEELNAEVTSDNMLTVKPTSNAGEYNIAIQDRNHLSTALHIYIRIEKANPQITLNDKSVVYSGNNVTADTATVTLKNGETFTKNVSYDYYTDENCNYLLTEPPKNAGTYYAKAYAEAQNDNYNAYASNPAKITIEKANQTLTGSTIYSGYPGSNIQIDTESSISTDLHYTSEDESIAQLDATGKMTLLNEGTTKVKTYSSGNENYNGAILEATVTVDKSLTNASAAGKISISDSVYNNEENSNSNSNNSSNSNKSSNSENSSNSDSSPSETQPNTTQGSSMGTAEENNGADQFWNTILKTGDNSGYIVLCAAIAATISILAIIWIKRKK